MNDAQREFWRALTAPFPTAAYKERKGRADKTFTYLEPRTIMNRLDDVAGPSNWHLEYRETTRGIICRITIMCPDGSGNRYSVHREGGGGFRDMQDDDSSFKTGFSSSIKTAAACFGIGRELYGEGMPAYCADLHDGAADDGHETGPPQRASGNNGQSNGNGYDKFKPPYGKPGKAPYAWAKAMGDHFHTDVLGKMFDYAKKRKKPERTDQWDEAFLDECLSKTVAWMRTLDNYNGEFGEAPPASQEPQQRTSPPVAAQAAGQPHSLVSPIVAACNALIFKQLGRESTAGELVGCIGELASSVPDGNGHRGEVLKSLRTCQDGVWLKNILNAANKRIQEAAVMAAADIPPEDDIPF